MPCGTKLSSNKNAKSNPTLTPDNLGYIPDCKISLASFVLYFHFLLIRSFISNRSFFFVSWSLLQKLNLY